MAQRAVDTRVGRRRRAPRYEIRAPIRYRTGRDDWHEGTTVNIGGTGVLMRTRHAVPALSKVVQLRMLLSPDRGWTGTYVACRGRVVRTQTSAVSGERLVAMTIDAFTLRPARPTECSCFEKGTTRHRRRKTTVGFRHSLLTRMGGQSAQVRKSVNAEGKHGRGRD